MLSLTLSSNDNHFVQNSVHSAFWLTTITYIGVQLVTGIRKLEVIRFTTYQVCNLSGLQLNSRWHAWKVWLITLTSETMSHTWWCSFFTIATDFRKLLVEKIETYLCTVTHWRVLWPNLWQQRLAPFCTINKNLSKFLPEMLI